MTRSGDDETERPAPKALYIPGRSVDEVLDEMRQDRVKRGFGEMGSRMIDYGDPRMARRMTVPFVEHEAEGVEGAIASVTEVIGHATSVCAHVRDLIQYAAPSPVPMAAASILHMTFLALETLAHRECDILSDAESLIRRWRNRSVEEREEVERLAAVGGQSTCP
ncbi:MAG: hypothetical protein IPL38_07345 [Rhodobacter sp.]|nr:hypothetical protein [Rhodobacter sp.]